MARRWLRRGMLIILAVASLPALGAHRALAADESYFVEKLYPVLHAAQCVRCHNDNGVASETRLSLPTGTAGKEQLTAFGLRMLDLVDRKNPDQSQLLLKPTSRKKHSGGTRIKPGSDEEKVLVAWINYLAGLSDDEVRQAREKIARAEELSLSPLTMRRLTHSQYNHTVRDLLGDQTLPANNFPKEDFIHGFKNQLEGQGIAPLQAEAYGQAAERLAAGAFRAGDHRRLIPVKPTSATDGAAADAFVRDFGRRAFRRPLTDSEAGTYARLLLGEANRTRDFIGGAKLVVETMLQSPHFLFRVERGSSAPFEQYEIASRLSYFLWDTMPTGEMLEAAEKGEFATAAQVEKIARRMLDDPRAQASLHEFLAQWMRFDRLLSATRDRRRYREFNPEIAVAMAEETRRLFDHLVWQDKNFMEFFTADYTFISSDLAKIYDLPAPAEEFARVSYPADSGRSGVLGQGTFLVLTSKPTETSPTARGLFVRNQFLGHEVPPPPPGVTAVLPVVTEASPMTNRQRLDVHLNSEACSNCHRLIDPIGFGFEQYNAIGGFQKKMSLMFTPAGRGDAARAAPATVELDLDTSAYIQGIDDSSFATPRELGRILAHSKTCQKCIVKQLFRYTFGREETERDQPVLDALLVKFRDSGFRFRELVVAMATSKLFLQKGSD